MESAQPHLFDFSKPSGLAMDSADQLSAWINNCCGLIKEMWSEMSNSPREFQAKFSEATTFLRKRDSFSPTAVCFEVLIGKENLTTILMVDRVVALAYALEMVGETCVELPQDRELSPLEQSLVELLFQYMAEFFGAAWPKKEPIKSRLGQFIDSPHRSRVFDPQEMMLAYKFVAKADFGEHDFLWLVPQNPMEDLISEPIQPLEGAVNNDQRARIETLAKAIPVNVVVVLGEAKIPVADLPSLRVGDVIVLDQRIEEPIHVKIANETKFAGWPGRKGSRHAVQIDSVH